MVLRRMLPWGALFLGASSLCAGIVGMIAVHTQNPLSVLLTVAVWLGVAAIAVFSFCLFICKATDQWKRLGIAGLILGSVVPVLVLLLGITFSLSMSTPGRAPKEESPEQVFGYWFAQDKGLRLLMRLREDRAGWIVAEREELMKLFRIRRWYAPQRGIHLELTASTAAGVLKSKVYTAWIDRISHDQLDADLRALPGLRHLGRVRFLLYEEPTPEFEELKAVAVEGLSRDSHRFRRTTIPPPTPPTPPPNGD